MPNLDDIAGIAEALQACPIAVKQDSCLSVRNRLASCRRCVEICSERAISVNNNEATVAASLCTNCGACLAVCPTRALSALKPTRAELAAEVADAMASCADVSGCENVAIIACARRASKREADAALFATAPCLAHLDEGLLVQIASCGAKSILLVDGVCSTCKHRDSDAAIDETVRQARLLIDAFGGTTDIVRSAAFPDQLKSGDVAEGPGESRRAFFGHVASSAKEGVTNAAVASLKQQFGAGDRLAPIGERLHVDDTGALPKIPVPFHEGLIDALDRIGAPAVDTLAVRTFATIDIDTSRCNACGMCAAFCPTTALVRNSGEVSLRVEYLEFQASDCIACGLCADVCFKRCLSVKHEVHLDELLDFEPRTISLA